jgi:hypothetical protein
MLKSVKIQAIAMLAIGGLIGYAIASHHSDLASRSSAAETSPVAAATNPSAAPTTRAPVCLT